QTDRSAAEVADPTARRDLAEVEAVQRDTERLEERRVFGPDLVRERAQQAARPGHRRAERAIGAGEPREPARRAQVGPSGATPFASFARVERVRDDALPGSGTVGDHAAEL